MAKQQTIAQQIAAAINRGFKDNPASLLSKGAESDVVQVIPTGVEPVDRYVLGIGGLPCRRISEVFCEEGGGKTSLMLSTAGNAQKMGGVAVIVETEKALESRRAETFGCDLDQVVLLEPMHLDDVGPQLEAALKAIPPKVGPVFIGWDSVAATPSKEEVEEGLAKSKGFDKRAKAISQIMRAIGPLVARADAHLMLINQVRDNIGVMFGPDVSTPGGHAIKHHASIRLQILGGKAIKDPAGRHLGKDVTVMAVKNKLAHPYRKCRARLIYATGWDTDWSTLNHAKELKLVQPLTKDAAKARAALDAADWWRLGGEESTSSEED